MLRIRSLGRLDTQLNGSTIYKPTSIKNKKKFLFVAYLCEQKEPQARAHLAKIFWPESDVTSGLRSLNTLVFRLRKDSLEPYINSTKHFVQFTKQTAPIEFDLDKFRHIAEKLTSDSTLDQLEAPFKLYHGPFLQNCDLSDLPEIADWAYAIQHEIESKLLVVYRMLAPRLIDAGMATKGIEYGRLLTTLVREDEPTWEWFVRCLVAQGDVAQALQVLSGYRQEALTKDPNHRFSASLIELGSQLSDPSQVAELMQTGYEVKPQVGRVQQAESNATQYITPLSEVIGRESDQKLLLNLIDQGHRLISVVGLGGVGKTTLIRCLIPSLIQRYNQQVTFVELHLDTKTDPSLTAEEHLLGAIGQPFGIANADLNKTVHLLRTQSGDQSFCILLDNFETVTGAALVVGKLIDQLSGLTVLISSRSRLNLRREVVLQLDGLPLMDESENYDQVGPAQRLFERAAQRQSPAFKLSEDNLETVFELCRHLDGLPLAIELVTQQLHHYSIRELITRSQASGRFLHSDMIDVREEHRSIHQLLQTMWQNLSATAQAILPELTRFANEWSIEAMEAIVPAERAIYNELLNTSMLQQVSPGQFKLHPLIKQFAANHQNNEMDTLLIFETDQSDADINRLEKRYQQGLSHTQEQDAELRFALLAGLIRSKFVLHENPPELPEMGERLVALAKELNDSQKLIQATIYYGKCIGLSNQNHKSVEILEQALILAEENGEQFLEEKTIVLFELATALSYVNRFAEAEDKLTESRKIVQTIQSSVLDFRVDLLDCNLKFDLGEFDAALEYSLRLVEKCRQKNELLHLCYALNILENTYVMRHDFEKRYEALLELRGVAQQIGNSEFERVAMTNLGHLQIALGQFDEALVSLTFAYQSFRQVSNWLNSAIASKFLADLYFETGQLGLAEKMYIQAMNLYDKIDSDWEEAEAQQWYGFFLLECDRLDEAEHAFLKAENLLTDEMWPTNRIYNQCAQSWLWCLSDRKHMALENLEDLYLDVNQFDANDGQSDDGWDAIHAVLYFIYVLDSLGDDRSDDLLERAYKWIHNQAENIHSLELRESFMLNPRVHQKIFDLHERKFGVEASVNGFSSVDL